MGPGVDLDDLGKKTFATAGVSIWIVLIRLYQTGGKRERERGGGGLTNYSLHRSHYLTDVEAEACTGFWWGNLRERDRLGDPGVDGRIILRWFFGKRDVRVYTESSWLRIGTGGGHL